MKHFTEGSAGLVTIEFPGPRWPLQGWRCAVYAHLPDGTEKLMEDVANALIRVDATETVTAGVTIAKIVGETLVYEQAFYDVVEVRVRGADRGEEVRGQHVSRLAHLRMSAGDLVRGAVDAGRRLTHRACSAFPR